MTGSRSFWNEIVHFIIHLRWHYQVFILSGSYLLGAFLSFNIDWSAFWVQFLNVHLLLFGGATAYNSYWDKDEGPVGGLQAPPPMQRWMWSASLLLQVIGLWIAIYAGLGFAGIYGSSMLLFWLYSTPHARWKGAPLRSLLAIGISTGTNSVFMGYLASGSETLSFSSVIAAMGVGFMVLSLYPVSQLYQQDEDQQRGDQTFAIRFGFRGVTRFFGGAFFAGVLLVALAIGQIQGWLGGIFLGIGLSVGNWIYRQLKTITAKKEDYQTVMRIKYGTSLAFVIFLSFLLVLKYVSPDVFT